MDRRHGAESGVPDPHPATSPSSSQHPRPPHRHHASSGDPGSSLTHPLKHLGSPIASGSGSGSSSSKLPQWSFGGGTAASLSSHIHTSNTSLTTPNLVESPRPISPAGDGKQVPLSALTGLQAPSPGTSPPSQADSPPLPADRAQEPSTSSSSDEQLPTRASIRAWAKATPAGPPRNSPSPSGSNIVPQSSSDENIDDRQSITRSAGHHTASSVSQERTSGSASGVSSSDEDDSVGSGLNVLNLPFPDDSSGNIADIDSSGSGGEDASPQDTSDPSPSVSPSHRELLAPAPLHPTQPQPQSQTHPESSASQSPPPAPVLTSAQIQEQQDRIDRRVDRHPPHHHHQGTTRRRHRDHRDREHRERRSRPSNPTPPSHTHSQPQPQSPGHSTLPPLRIIPDLRLPAPPPPLRPLRPLQVSSGGGDVLDDISRMLHFSRRPLLRTSVDPGGTRGAFHSPPRNNDVLDDICFMIHMSSGR